MAFIRCQNVKRGPDGRILSGSASIIDVTYTGAREGVKGHSKQSVRESLGRILALADDRRSGIFLSPTRGIVSYDVERDEFANVDADDPAVAGLGLEPETEVHKVFGDGYLMVAFMENSGMMGILRDVFRKDADRQRCVAHLYHSLMRNGGKDRCDLFVAKSFVSYITPDAPGWSLRSDTAYFERMGADSVRLGFFRAFVDLMRSTRPGFGRCCYVDSTPLPNDIDDNPFNALNCHGMNAASVQMRLVVILDIDTGLPVWYTVVPGNMLDIKTVKSVIGDAVQCLGISVEELVLDAGYVSKELIEAIHVADDPGDGAPWSVDGFTPRTMVARMPAKKGYPYRLLYHQTKDLYSNGKYDFVRNRHTYFGHRKEVEIFGQREYAYVYVDQENALTGYKKFISDHEDRFEELPDREKRWKKVESGYFVLVSNRLMEPSEMLDTYFGRVHIEGFFRDGKEYLGLLPLSKWTDLTVRGKILSDMVAVILRTLMKRELAGSPYAMTDIPTITQSLMCRLSGGTVMVEYPNKQTKQVFAQYAIEVPKSIGLSSFLPDS